MLTSSPPLQFIAAIAAKPSKVETPYSAISAPEPLNSPLSYGKAKDEVSTNSHVTAKARLSDEATPESICLDTGCSVTLLDRTFSKSQNSNVKIRTMATPIPVRGIGSDKHMTSEYVIVPIYLVGDDVEAVVTREAHLVDGLCAKMLVGMDIMGPEQIDIITLKKQDVIGSCENAVISIKVHPQSRPT